MQNHWLDLSGGRGFVCAGVALVCLHCGGDDSKKPSDNSQIGTSGGVSGSSATGGSATSSGGSLQASGGTPASGGLGGGDASAGTNAFGGSGSSAGSGGTNVGGTDATGGRAAGGAASVGGSVAAGGVDSVGGTSSSGGSAQAGSGGMNQAGSSNQWPSEGCGKLALNENLTIAEHNVDRLTYGDSTCKPRTAAMARLGQGYLRQATYQLTAGKTRTITGTGEKGSRRAGFGHTSNHNLDVTGQTDGKYEALFVGDYHAIYEYKFDVSKDLPVTIQWLFVTGRDHPVIAITYNMTARAPGIGADTRTPYGDLRWDGDDNKGNTVVSGVGWGDRYKFITTKAPLTKNSTWDYTQPNIVPYVIEWTDSPDAEMGLVQTQTWQQKDAGGYWHYVNWGKTSENQVRDTDQVGVMPVLSNWTYQLNQYELCPGTDEGCNLDATTASHRMAWGANYGAIGGKTADGKYDAYGGDKQLVGYPYQSYSVFMVLGEHSRSPVFAQVANIEAIQSTTFTATVGAVATMVPAGVGRTDLVTASPAGYDHRYSVWSVEAAQNRAVMRLSTTKGALTSPSFVVSNFTASALPTLVVDGELLRANVDYFMSLDATTGRLWITLPGSWSGTHDITVVKP
jgi:hypothetical protein